MANMFSENGDSQDNSDNDSDFVAAMDANGAEDGPLPVYRLERGASMPMNAMWDPETAIRLRQNHGLTGDLSGTMPKHPSQNQHLTMPLLLTEEEVAYGVSHGALSIFSEGPSCYASVTDASIRDFFSVREARIKSHVESAVRHQREERAKRSKDPNTILRKRKLQEVDSSQKHAQELDLCSNPQSAPSSGPNDEGIFPALKRRRPGILNTVTSSLRHILYTLTGTYYFAPPDARIAPSGDPTDKQDGHSLTPKNSATPTTIASPSTEIDEVSEAESARQEVLETKVRKQAATTVIIEAETATREDEMGERNELDVEIGTALSPRARSRQLVFDDLRKRGYSLTCGAKFGADFLAYATDPLLVHASLAVVVIDGDEDISTYDVVALGRLGDATRKRTVLAWTDVSPECSDANRVNYVGIQWEETLP